jgi:hypothetical protein
MDVFKVTLHTYMPIVIIIMLWQYIWRTIDILCEMRRLPEREIDASRAKADFGLDRDDFVLIASEEFDRGSVFRNADGTTTS